MSAQPNPTVPFDCSELVEDGNYRVQLAPGVWLMDNHKWALLAWERERVPGRRYVLVHADFHWDGVDDFVSDGAPTKELLAADVDELQSMIADDKYIRFDSFIAPAVRRGLLSEVHFSCHDDDGNDVGLDADLALPPASNKPFMLTWRCSARFNRMGHSSTTCVLTSSIVPTTCLKVT